MTQYEESPKPGTQNKRTSKKGKGLSGAESGSSTAVELTKPLLVVGGLLVGNLTGKLIDKFIPINADEKGVMKIVKTAIKPLVQAGLGVGVILLSREKGNEEQGAKTIKAIARSLGYGVAGSGVISTVKLVKADLFAGLGDNGDTKPIEAKYYTEAKDEIMKMLQDNSFKPALPEGSSMSSLPQMRESEGLENLGNSEDLEGFQEAEII